MPLIGIARRHDARGAQLVDDAPEIEMLQRALGEVLALGNPLRLGAALHQRAGYAAQPELDGERHADRPAAHDDDLVPLLHPRPLSTNRKLLYHGKNSNWAGREKPCHRHPGSRHGTDRQPREARRIRRLDRGAARKVCRHLQGARDQAEAVTSKKGRRAPHVHLNRPLPRRRRNGMTVDLDPRAPAAPAEGQGLHRHRRRPGHRARRGEAARPGGRHHRRRRPRRRERDADHGRAARARRRSDEGAGRSRAPSPARKS